nr:hypothetical protein [Candidatus Sigynarchaeum springense]
MEPKPTHFECPSCKATWPMQCAYCKATIKAAAYVCPECATFYCMRCTIVLSERKDSCSKCGKPLWSWP